MLKKFFIPLLLVLCSYSSCSLFAAPPKKYPIKDFFDTIVYKGGDISFDSEKVTLSGNQSGIFNIYITPSDKSALSRLTDSKVDSYNAESFFPKDYRILFSHDEGGNEIYHQFVLDKNSKIIPIPAEKNERMIFLHWKLSGDGFYCLSNKRDAAIEDLIKINAQTYEITTVWENPDLKTILTVAPNERYIALTENDGLDGEHMVVYDLQQKKYLTFTEKDPNVNETPIQFSNDSQWLYYFTNKDKEFSYINRVNLATGKIEFFYGADWEINFAYISKNEKYFVMTINENGKYKLRILSYPDKKEVSLPSFDYASVAGSAIPSDERSILLQLESPTQPLDYYVYFFDTQKIYRLTNALNEKIDPADLVNPEHVSFPSFDGKMIPALFFKPKGTDPKEKLPAILMVHGGPTDQYRYRWYPDIQYFVNQGYAILAVNYRGSVGYGKSFKRGAQGSQGVTDLKDAIAGKKYLVSRGDINPDKIGIKGGSYGGYLTLSALAFYPNEFAVGIDLFGPSNWVRTIKNFPEWWNRAKEKWYKKFGVTSDATMEEQLTKVSPLFHANAIKKPLFVMQGSNDPRVRKEESEDIVNTLKKNGVPVEFLLFENEGHGGVQINENEIILMEALTKFLNKYLKN